MSAMDLCSVELYGCAGACVRARMYVDAWVRKVMRRCVGACLRACLCACMRPCMRSCMGEFVFMCAHMCMCAYARAYIGMMLVPALALALEPQSLNFLRTLSGCKRENVLTSSTSRGSQSRVRSRAHVDRARIGRVGADDSSDCVYATSGTPWPRTVREARSVRTLDGPLTSRLAVPRASTRSPTESQHEVPCSDSLRTWACQLVTHWTTCLHVNFGGARSAARGGRLHDAPRSAASAMYDTSEASRGCGAGITLNAWPSPKVRPACANAYPQAASHMDRQAYAYMPRHRQTHQKTHQKTHQHRH